MAEHVDRKSAEAESVPGADTSLQVLCTPAPRAVLDQLSHITSTHAPELWARLQGELETLAFMELSDRTFSFQTGICHKFIDDLIELSEVRERHVHSISSLLKLGTPESGPSPWNMLLHSLLLDMTPPVQLCWAQETLSGPMIWQYAFLTYILVCSWFRKCFFGDTTQLKQTITSFSRSLSETLHRWLYSTDGDKTMNKQKTLHLYALFVRRETW